MTESQKSKNLFRFLEKSYQETLHLLTFARDYFNTKGRQDKITLSKEESIAYTLAMTTITTQLTSSLGWLLMCRAVQHGEVSINELSKDDMQIPIFEPHIDAEDSIFYFLNQQMKELLVKSASVYNRVKRMEKQLNQSIESETIA